MKTNTNTMKTKLQPKRNQALAVYVASVTLVVLSYTLITASQYL
ncbi:hypothetical protein [Altibacter sp. HG106]|nr:hypothetical protein [Altibacter sp. HG106]MDC7993906.1 hypothetical protein [Altibacter sp. HG106]